MRRVVWKVRFAYREHFPVSEELKLQSLVLFYLCVWNRNATSASFDAAAYRNRFVCRSNRCRSWMRTRLLLCWPLSCIELHFPFWEFILLSQSRNHTYLIFNGFIKQFSTQFLVLENFLTSHGTYLLCGKQL